MKLEHPSAAPYPIPEEHFPLFMSECLKIAAGRRAAVAPNPMVGCVIATRDGIIASGAHTHLGGPHAEVNAISELGRSKIPQDAVVFINLEPCAHYGKTPPCVDLLLERQCRHLVIGTLDPFPQVAGRGVAKMREHGVNVSVGTLARECCQLNKRFIVSHSLGRPLIILKWAQTTDGFIAPLAPDADRTISNLSSRTMVHQWRAQEDAILVGSTTARIDNPHLNVRLIEPSRTPLRIVFDRSLSLPPSLHLFDGSARTMVVFDQALAVKPPTINNVTHLPSDWSSPYSVLDTLLAHLHSIAVQSVLIEGGTSTLNHFLRAGLWDEIRVFTSPKVLGDGVQAPDLASIFANATNSHIGPSPWGRIAESKERIEEDLLHVIIRDRTI